VLEKLARNVIGGAGATDAHVNRARMTLCVLDELPQVGWRKRWMRDEQMRGHRDQRDRRKVFERNVRQTVVQAGRNRDRCAVRHQQRVAIGRRLRGYRRADRKPCARAIVDHHRLPPTRSQLLSNLAHQNVNHPASAPCYHAHGLGRIGFLLRRVSCRRRAHQHPACDQG
jgi:hypothetical protein